ncbi:MAG TPA: ABC transporter permease [Bacteroidia bacterium]|nr:ABC transporter permease [Bacteroidia bacterium]
MKLLLHIANKHLLSRKKTTVVAILGVTFGIAMFIIMISFMTGINDFLSETTLTSTPHIRLYNDVNIEEQSITDRYYSSNPGHLTVIHNPRPKNELPRLKNGLRVAEQLKRQPEELAVSPTVSSQVFYNYGPTQLNGVLTGVDILSEDRMFDLKPKMRSGSLEDLLAANDAILMGVGLAKKLNVKKGDKVIVSTPLGNTLTLRIVGTFSYGVGAIDNVRSYATIQTVQKVLGQSSSYITDINLKLKDINQAKHYAPIYAGNFSFTAEDWETANATILVSFVVRNALTIVVVTTLLIVAGFGIYNIMSMTINEKMKDIAILKATGFAGKDVVRIFLTQTIIIGVCGALLGLVIGYMVSYFLSTLPFDGGEFLDMEHFPVAFMFKHYAFGVGFGVVTTFLAGYFPARKAARVDPVKILRG